MFLSIVVAYVHPQGLQDSAQIRNSPQVRY